ncbi:hypothetical protein BX600DRAFT_540278 [Xylariales sp. PMI_506]|nr:hypothetical protein BX600DRAFT_540278 [Xylariales sp. PMI_506]
MIETVTLAEARVLIVGDGSLSRAVQQRLEEKGVRAITILSADDPAAAPIPNASTIQKDPIAYIGSNIEFFKSFHLVIAVNQPRGFEISLSDARWPVNAVQTDPDLPIIVSRCAGNNCKMRCQYRQLPVKGGDVSSYINLATDLPTWNDEKRRLVTTAIDSELELDSNLKTYFDVALALLEFHQSTGAWPGVENSGQIEGAVARKQSNKPATYASQISSELVSRMCEGGFAAVPETIDVMSRLISRSAATLLTGEEQPFNHVNIDDVIRIVTNTI